MSFFLESELRASRMRRCFFGDGVSHLWSLLLSIGFFSSATQSFPPGSKKNKISLFPS